MRAPDVGVAIYGEPPDGAAMDLRHALMLQVEWGADEALESAPQDRTRRSDRRPSAAATPPAPAMALPGGPSDDSRERWIADLSAFDGGGLAATATHRVAPSGRVSVASGGLMVVGGTPGDEEDRSGDAMAGRQGALLRRMLASIALDPAEVLFAYVVPWRPPGGRAPTDAELASCLPFLHRLIALDRPRLLLALGSVPAKALLGSRLRQGRWSPAQIQGLAEPLAVLPTANPAVLLKQPGQKARAWAELRMLRRRISELTNF